MVDDAMGNRPHKIDGREVETKRAVPRDVNPELNLTLILNNLKFIVIVHYDLFPVYRISINLI